MIYFKQLAACIVKQLTNSVGLPESKMHAGFAKILMLHALFTKFSIETFTCAAEWLIDCNMEVSRKFSNARFKKLCIFYPTYKLLATLMSPYENLDHAQTFYNTKKS